MHLRQYQGFSEQPLGEGDVGETGPPASSTIKQKNRRREYLSQVARDG